MDKITEHFFSEPHLEHLNPIAIGNTYIYKGARDDLVEVVKITRESITFRVSLKEKDPSDYNVVLFLHEEILFKRMSKVETKPIKKRTRLRFLNDK